MKFFHKRSYRHRPSEKFAGAVFVYPKHDGNVGSAMRTASCLNCIDFFVTIGESYTCPKSDVVNSWKRKPVFNFETWQKFYDHRPMCCELIAVEMSRKSVELSRFKFPPRSIFVFGSERDGLSEQVLKNCRYKVELPSPIGISMNLANAASIVFYEWHKELNNGKNSTI